MKELSWIAIARAAIGQAEIPGAPENSWIQAIWRRVGAPWFTSENTPWCASFVAYCCVEAGLKIVGPAKAAQALAWKDHGLGLNGPAYGCIAVKERNGGGHVGFVVGRFPNGKLGILGGNQNNSVSIAAYDESVFVAFRWPSLKPSPERYQLPLLKSDGSAAAVTEA